MNGGGLGALRDLHLPPAPAPWPPAPGWWLAALGVALLVALALRRRRRRPLREALRELDRCAAAYRRSPDAIALARGLSSLLRRYALARFPAARVAGLEGGAWLQFLDRHGGSGDYTRGEGARLASLPYRADGSEAPLAPEQADALVMLVRRWLRGNAP